MGHVMRATCQRRCSIELNQPWKIELNLIDIDDIRSDVSPNHSGQQDSQLSSKRCAVRQPDLDGTQQHDLSLTRL